MPGLTAALTRTAVVNFADLARQEALGLAPKIAPRPLIHEGEMEQNEMDEEPGAELSGPISPEALITSPSFVPLLASPSPSTSYMGLDDIPMVDSMYIIIPPDVAGGLGPSKVMESFNNNYRIRDKVTGATQLTVGTATFWNPVITNKALLNQLTDPRTVYDPIEGRWIVAMQTVNTNGLILFGVSLTSDPGGSWFLYAVTLSGSYLLDFPNIGFNKNWICVSINRYTTAGAFSFGTQVVADYAAARAGTLSSVSIFSGAAGTRFCAAPCATISATEDTLFLVTHLGSAAATYQVDRITGTPAAPVYTSGGTTTRPGGGWTQPSGNLLPQSAPNSGASDCGVPPCPIETQDAQVRSAPVFRVDNFTGRQFIYYTQTIQLSGPTRTAAQWTKITASTTPAFADGGRIDDATGAKWHAYPHISVNSSGDFIVGYSQFGSAQHPAAGYSVHFAYEGLGTIRDVLLYKPGDDYYHKTLTTTTGRNRWGDFSTAQVDPSDDRSLWVLQEYGKTRTGTDDGNTGSNSSRWSSYWAKVDLTPTVTIAAGPSLNEGNAGTTSFNFTVNLSLASSVPVTVNFHTSDGTATVADADYQAQTSSIVIPAGSTSGTITVLVNGDTKCESNETFNVTLDSATNGNIGSPSTSAGTILTDETKTILASAGSGGTISPSGTSTFSCGADQTHTIAANSCFSIADVVVDGLSRGALSSYTFLNIAADHAITASFSANGSYTIEASAGTGGSISPSGSVSVACGASQTFTISPDACHSISNVVVDGSSFGAVGSYTFTNVQTQHTISATFASLLTLTETHANATCAGEPNGSINLTVSGGTPPYTFLWSNGATTEDVSNLVAGNYSVTVADVNGCTTNLTVTVGVAGSLNILAIANGGGSVAPPGTTAASCGSSPTYTITPDPGYAIVTVMVDNDNMGAVTSYTFTNVTTHHTITGIFGQTTGVDDRPSEFALSRPYPNPTNGNPPRIDFAVARNTQVRLSIVDVTGHEVRVLAEGKFVAGRYSVIWDARTGGGRAAPGIYFVRYAVPGRQFVQRLVLSN